MRSAGVQKKRPESRAFSQCCAGMVKPPLLVVFLALVIVPFGSFVKTTRSGLSVFKSASSRRRTKSTTAITHRRAPRRAGRAITPTATAATSACAAARTTWATRTRRTIAIRTRRAITELPWRPISETAAATTATFARWTVTKRTRRPVTRGRRTRTIRHRVQRADIGRLRTLGAVFQVVFDPLTFVQGPKTLPGNIRKMGEDVISTLTWRDEPKTFGFVEPLHNTGWHGESLSFFLAILTDKVPQRMAFEGARHSILQTLKWA